MPDPVVFNPQLDESLQWAGGGSGKNLGLPADLVREVPRRLAILCGLLIVSNFITEALTALTAAGQFHGGIRYSATALLISAAAVTLLLSWRRTLSAWHYLNLAVAFEIVWAGTEAFATAQGTWSSVDATPVDYWSSTSVIVLIYPIIVPNSMARTFIGSLLSVSAEILAVVVLAREGIIPTPSTTVWVSRLVPATIAIGAAVVVSRLMYSLGRRLAEQRAAGSYMLEELLGHGGMGEVWRATHKFLARPAAVKLIRPALLRDAGNGKASVTVQRFEREAQATAALRSLHTVDLYDFGVAKDGTFYYAMELLDGVDMSTMVLEDGPQTPERTVFLLRQACASLQEAHERGLVHRDVKPANIFVCRYPATVDFVKVLDFGMVKSQQRTDDSLIGLTKVGRITGTPAFLPPEQVVADYPVDARSDIYGLGCVAYWLLTGLPVFDRETGMQMVVAHAREIPTPISEHVPGVGPDLERVVMDCLEKNPDHRPSSAMELSERLAALHLEHLWTQERAQSWWAARAGPP